MKTQWFSRVLIGFVSVLSLGIFCWPILVGDAAGAHAGLAQTIFMVLMPLLVAIVLIEFSTGGIDSRQIALLGVLIALNSVIRMLGAGTAGIETAFFLILIGAYVFGASFGYLLGAGSLLVSALLTGGIGPWLPFQMMAAGLIGVMAGLLPRPASKRIQLALLSLVAVFGSYTYGALMTMWNWPFLAGTGTSLSYVAGGGIAANLGRFINFEIVTGGLLWDTGRAITTCALVLITAPALLATLKRAARKAGYQRR